MIATSPFVSSCFTSDFTKTGMTFYNFLELHLPLLEKRFLSMNFPFLMDSPKPLHPLNSQYSLSVTKICLFTIDNLAYLNHQTRYFSKFCSAN